MDLVREYIRRNETPVLILGESGVGKSTLLNQVVCRADHNWRVVRMPAVHSFSADDIVTFLNAELRLPTRVSVEKMLSAFDGWLNRLAMRGQVAVVVVDDAHDLCDESLARLSTLREDMPSKNLCVLMTGEPDLRTRTSAHLGPPGSPAPIHAINIPSLDRHEVTSYIDMRLYHAGMEGRGPFSRATINDIARSSRGHPGRINALANNLLTTEGKRLHWQRASQRIRRIMRHWLTLTVVTATVALSAIVAPGGVRTAAGEGAAATHAPKLLVTRRNRRVENEPAQPSYPSRAARVLLVLRGILPRLWGNGR
jgi:type II secretory pathway predicted ATPase ExeA